MKQLEKKVVGWVAGGQLVVLKVLLFLFFGATHSLIPYLVVHMRQLGIDVNQTAIIHAVLPVAMFIGPPISGFLADKSGGFRILLFVSLIMTGVSHTCLLWVPSAAPADQLSRVALACHPANRSLDLLFGRPSPLSCSINDRHALSLSDCRPVCPSPYAAPDQAPSSGEVFCGGAVASGSVCVWRAGEGRFGAWAGANDSVRAFSSKDAANSSGPCGQLMPNGNCSLWCARPEGWEAFRDVECGDRKLTFWVYLVVRVVASVFMSSCYVLLDAITLILIKDSQDTDYGKQRVWPVVATAVFPPITGALVDSISTGDNPNYTPTFYVHDALILLTALLSPLLSLKMKFSQETNVKAVVALAKTPRADALIVSLFCLGTMWGFVEVFLYLYLLDLGSPKYLLGLTLTVGSGVGIPVLFFSGRIIDRFGHVPIVFVAFLFYAVRYIGYSFIYDPWWCLAFEAMEIFTLHLLWVAVVRYSSMLAPKGLQATMQGAIGGTHYGVGRGSGSLIGGLLMGRFGARATFFYMGIASGIAGVVYIAVEKVFFRKPFVSQSQNNNNEKDGDVDLEKKSDVCDVSTISGNKDHMEEIRL